MSADGNAPVCVSLHRRQTPATSVTHVQRPGRRSQGGGRQQRLPARTDSNLVFCAMDHGSHRPRRGRRFVTVMPRSRFEDAQASRMALQTHAPELVLLVWGSASTRRHSDGRATAGIHRCRHPPRKLIPPWVREHQGWTRRQHAPAATHHRRCHRASSSGCASAPGLAGHLAARRPSRSTCDRIHSNACVTGTMWVATARFAARRQYQHVSGKTRRGRPGPDWDTASTARSITKRRLDALEHHRSSSATAYDRRRRHEPC